MIEDGSRRFPGLQVLKAGEAYLALHLQPGAPPKRVEALVDELCHLVTSLSYTKHIT